MEVRIYYEDTDCGGVVYYGNYLKYFERARTQYLEERGLSVSGLMKEGTTFVVVHAEVDYRSPARYGDRLIVETVVSEMTAASFTFSHVIRERESRRVVVEGSARLAKWQSEATRQSDGSRITIGAFKESLKWKWHRSEVGSLWPAGQLV
jgi:acyl-CoA thioester hydrolase